MASPAYFKIATGDSVREIADAIADVPAVALLSPAEQFDFQFFKSPRRDANESASKRIRLALHWRKANCTWIPQMPVYVFTSESDLEKMGQALG